MSTISVSGAQFANSFPRASKAGSGGASKIEQIDRQIQALQKEKGEIVQEMMEVAMGDGSEKEKKEKLRVLSMQVQSIDAQISFLMSKKAELLKEMAEAKENNNGNQPAREKDPNSVIDLLI